jgi:hypothetical protein
VGARPDGVFRSRRMGAKGGEDGNVLVLFAILLTLFLVCGAIVIDVGYWWATGKRAQIAADACALAAAQELPRTYDDMGHCVVVAGQGDYVLTNVPDQSLADPEPKHLWTRVRSPYAGDENMVEATVRLRVGTFFGRIVGLHWVDVERRAVAERAEGDTKLAIFAGSTDCGGGKGLRIDGDAINITGHAHSNGEFTINGAVPPEQVSITQGTIAKENCVADTNPDGPPPSSAGAKFGSGPDWLPEDGLELQWPDWWYPADFGWYLPEGTGPGRCTYKGEHIQIDATQLKITDRPPQDLADDPDKPGWKRIPTGTYCATGSFQIGGNTHTGEITVLSPNIVIDGNGQEYTPHVGNMLFFTVPNSNMDAGDDGPFTLGIFDPPHLPPYPPCMPSPAADSNLNGENYTWAGIIFNPCGKVKINNKTSSIGTPQLVGTIYGFMVEINGDDFNMEGTEDIEQNLSIALVE